METNVLIILGLSFLIGFCDTDGEVDTKSAEQSKEDITKRVKEMDNAGIINDKKMENKLDAINKNIDSLKVAKPKGLKEATAINNAISGLPEIVAGIQTKNYAAVILGGLKVTAAICVLIPVTAPFALVGTVILSSLTTILSLFTSGKKEQTADPLQSALERFKIEGLKDEIASVSYAWDIMITSLSRFEDFINSGEVITSTMAIQFYSNSFRSVGIFGKLKSYIEQYCIVADHTDSKTGKSDIKTCLDLVTKYADLSIMRGYILTRMAGIIHLSEMENKKNDEVKAKQMTQIRMNFIQLADKQRELDKELIGFLTDPLNSFRSKPVIYELFKYPYQYTTLVRYLQNLQEQFPSMTDSEHVILCPEEKLGGLCRQMKKVDEYETWPYELIPTKSWFVPRGLKLSVKDTSSTEYGPYIGMDVYSPTTLPDLSHFKVSEDTNAQESWEYVMICNADEWCDSILSNSEQKVVTKIDNYHGNNYNKLQTVFVPPKLKVNIFDKKDETILKHSGPIYGPKKLEGIENCYTSWNTIEISPLNPGEDGTKMVELCSPKDNYCYQVEPGAEMENEEESFFDFFKSSPKQCKPTPVDGALNLDIPQGRRVTISKGNAKLGPFTGPASYPKLKVEKLLIQVEDLWVERAKKKHDVMDDDVMEDDSNHSALFSHPNNKAVVKTNKNGVSQKRHHQPRKYSYRPTNVSVEAVL